MATSARWYAQAGGNLIARLWVPQQMGVALTARELRAEHRHAPALLGHLGPGAPERGWLHARGQGDSLPLDLLRRRRRRVQHARQRRHLGPGVSLTTRYGVVYEMATTDKHPGSSSTSGRTCRWNGYFAVDFQTGILAVKAGPAV